MKSIVSAPATLKSSLAPSRRDAVNTPTIASSPYAITSRCCATSYSIEGVNWDLIIRMKASASRIGKQRRAAVIKGLRSRFALVLSGTPLENRLDDLYSVVQFIDDRRLGPAFRFYNRHRVIDEKGKVLGYKNLAELREKLQPVLLRRTRRSVRQQLPPRHE